MTKTIDKIELRFLQIADYESLKTLMQESYSGMKDSYWPEETIATLIEKFPDGQVAITVNDEVVGCALSIIVNYQKFGDNHTYPQICGDNYSFDTHDDDGDVLYGIDVFIKSSYRGMRLGRRIYDYRKELCENLNLKAIIFGGRLPNYHLHAKELSTKEYIQEVKLKKIYDPVLTFQLSNDFHVKKVMRGYLPGDKASKDYACLLQWDNIYYEAPSTSTPVSQKEYVRVGLVQWQMRPYNSLEELVEQAEYFIDAVSGYRCDFVPPTISSASRRPFACWPISLSLSVTAFRNWPSATISISSLAPCPMWKTTYSTTSATSASETASQSGS
jgi:Acetyltransferase (GNAT) family